jgi:ABC-type multidrug transport system fused ATPase/permease subunit
MSVRLRQKALSFIAQRPWPFIGLVTSSTLLIGIEGLGIGLILLIMGVDVAGDLPAKQSWVDGPHGVLSGLSVGERIRWAALVLLGLTLARTALTFAQKSLAVGLRVDITARLQKRILAQMHRLPLWYLQHQRSGGWTALLINQSREVGAMLETGALMPTNLLATMAYLLFSSLVSWQLTLLAMTPLVAILLLAGPWVSLRLKRANHEMQIHLRELSGIAQEHIAMTRLLRALNRQAWSQERFIAIQRTLNDREYRLGIWVAMSRPLFELFSVSGFALFILMGAYVLEGTDAERMSRIATFLVIALRLMNPVSQIVQFLGHYARAMPIVRAILDLHEDCVRLAMADGRLVLEDFRDGIQVDAVSFRYAADQPPVLRNLSLWIPHGRMTAIVGPSGSGKSSLVNLLARLYDPDEGAIRIDGQGLRDLDIASWRARIAVVGQEFPIFHGTVWENLRIVRPDATDAELIEVCRQAQAYDFIMALPEGYDTHLLERGTRLSGGQRQRLSLARALLTQCEVLILDEATSEVDPLTERAIQATLAQYRRHHTLVVIAHRLATIVDADCIYVMVAGRVVEQGNHAQLLAQDGLYQHMARAQHLVDS